MSEQPQQQRTKGQKRPYKKPELVQVPLKPDEAVLGGCKTAAGATVGPGNSNCRTPVTCFTAAS